MDALAILTIGLNVLVGTEMSRRIGTDIVNTGPPWGSDTLHLLGTTSPRRGRGGPHRHRADRRLRRRLPLERLGCGHARHRRRPGGRGPHGHPPPAGRRGRLGGVRRARGHRRDFLTSFPASGVTNTTGLLALTAIPAAVLGGLDSIAGAVVGGLIIGMAVTFAAGYQSEISFLGRGLSEVVP